MARYIVRRVRRNFCMASVTRSGQSGSIPCIKPPPPPPGKPSLRSLTFQGILIRTS